MKVRDQELQDDLKELRPDLKTAWIDWMREKMPRPISHVTLTYDEDPHHLKAEADFKRLVMLLNVRILGKKYKKFVVYSYFGFIRVTELQRNGKVHFHVLIDDWVDFGRLHELWQEWAGWAWIDPVTDPEKNYLYLAKYLVKFNVEPDVWFPKKEFRMDLLSGRKGKPDHHTQPAVGFTDWM